MPNCRSPIHSTIHPSRQWKEGVATVMRIQGTVSGEIAVNAARAVAREVKTNDALTGTNRNLSDKTDRSITKP